MLRIALIAIATALLAMPAHAQSYEGNWSCRDTQALRAGILTIYGQVYGFASTVFGDPSSGTGTITSYQDGVGFNDGPLRAARNIEAGRVIPDPNTGVAIQLETGNTIALLCTPR
jgi:hypothetical protein